MDFQSFDFNQLTQGENIFGEQKSAAAVDDRFYRLKRDENGNGAAIIRFLPDPQMKLMQQLFKINCNIQKNGQTRWVSELSPQNINQPDPFHKRWADLWNAGKKDDARKFARQTRFYTNILVVKDPASPENEGKVFLLDMSQSLKSLIEGLMFPSDADKALGVEPKQLFNPLQGNNFKLVSKKGSNGFINYDSSTAVPDLSAVFASKEEAIEAIKTKCHSLDEFLKPEAYKTYAELEEKLRYVTFETGEESPKQTTEVVDATAGSPSAAANAMIAQQEKDLDAFLDNI